MRESIRILLGIAGAAGSAALPGSMNAEPPAAADAGQKQQDSLEAHPAWKHLTETWREAGTIAAGQRGMYPFTDAEKKKLMEDLDRATRDVDELRAAHLLSAAEADLLKLDLPPLAAKVNGFRTKGMERATCYKPMALPAPSAHANLAQRLPLLEKIVAGRSLRPEVMSRVLQGIEQDLKLLAQPDYVARYPDAEQRREAIQIRQKAEREVQKIHDLLKASSGALEKSQQWRVVVDAWTEARPLAQTHRSTNAQRVSIDKKLTAAVAAARELATKGLLLDAETDLLAREAESLRREIYREPPTDSMVTCYDRAFIPPASESLARLSARLPLLEKLAANSLVHPAALEKVIPTIEEDLRVLGDEAATKLLPAAEKEKSQRMRKDAAEQLEKLKQQVGKAS